MLQQAYASDVPGAASVAVRATNRNKRLLYIMAVLVHFLQLLDH